MEPDVTTFVHSDSCKELMALVEKLMPWEKREFALHLCNLFLDESDMSDQYGFVDYDNIDVVKEVCDQGLTSEVLDTMESDDLLEYMDDHYEALCYEIKPHQLSHFITQVENSVLNSTLNYMKVSDPEAFERLKKEVNSI